MLKAGTGQGGGVERLFVTGVSPITMDDVTSGFNIGANVSLEPEFNEALGFTETEVRTVLETYRAHGAFSQSVDGAVDLMREWYDGYRFAEDAATDLYNPNQTVRRLLYGYLREAWDDVGAFSVDLYVLERLIGAMAYDGAWRPAVELLSAAVARQDRYPGLH